MFNKNKPYNNLPLLPGNFNFENSEILKLALKSSEEISKLNGLSYIIPNINILISPLLTKESVESSAIENINTTTLKVLQSEAIGEKFISGPEKEVLHYHKAILEGLKQLKKYSGLGYNSFLKIQEIVEPNKTGVRKIPGTIIADGYGKAVYTPPEGKENIDKLLKNLEEFINNFDDDIDPLIKIPVIHYQFESIHPFYDGNGRTGRIINILYLILAKKLDYPILFLSEYINKNKSKYYKLLDKTTQTGEYTDFIIFFLEAIIEQSKKTGVKILKIKELMEKTEINIEKINQHYHKITLLLFSKPFITVSDFTTNLGFSRQAVTKYINILEQNKIISSVKIGRNKLLFIPEFVELLS